MSELLTADRVQKVFRDCLFREEEIENGRPKLPHIEAHGITVSVGFHADRLNSYKAAIREMLNELPEKFWEGWSFLNACETRKSHRWTNSHITMQELFLLGLASKMVVECLPREAWGMLPGSVPYYQIVEDGSNTGFG